MLLTRTSPIGVHFGALDTRILQLRESRGRTAVAASCCVPAQGRNRQAAVAEHLAPRLKDLGFRGADCTVGLSGQEVAISLVPIDAQSRARLTQILQETAARSAQDEEGVEFRCLPLNPAGAKDAPDQLREEYLVFTVGNSDRRRSLTSLEALKWRPVGLEASAFPVVRALAPAMAATGAPWGVLHLGFSHSLFSIVVDGEIRFLKQMHLSGERLLGTLHQALRDGDAHGEDTARLAQMLTASSASGAEPEAPVGPALLPEIQRQAVGNARAIIQALKLEMEALSAEVRACVRHFSNRHRGLQIQSIRLTGFGASLPEVENAVCSAMTLETRIARPFTELGIQAPEEILAEEHLWTVPLGLALRTKA
jgi:Tfp pilus assembly PilM family ATPase